MKTIKNDEDESDSKLIKKIMGSEDPEDDPLNYEGFKKEEEDADNLFKLME